MGKVCNYLGGRGGGFPQGQICGSKAAGGEQEEGEHQHQQEWPCQQWADQSTAFPSATELKAQGPGRSRDHVSLSSWGSVRGGRGAGTAAVVPGVRVVHLCACLLVCLRWEGETVACGASLGLASPV